MADLLQQGAVWLTDQFRGHASRQVTYARGQASVVLPATVGRSSFTLDQGHVVLNLETRDYLIRASDLVLDGVGITPLPGDRITEADGTVYEVLPVAGEPAWRYCDPARSGIRIHTRQVDHA